MSGPRCTSMWNEWTACIPHPPERYWWDGVIASWRIYCRYCGRCLWAAKRKRERRKKPPGGGE